MGSVPWRPGQEFQGGAGEALPVFKELVAGGEGGRWVRAVATGVFTVLVGAIFAAWVLVQWRARARVPEASGAAAAGAAASLPGPAESLVFVTLHADFCYEGAVRGGPRLAEVEATPGLPEAVRSIVACTDCCVLATARSDEEERRVRDFFAQIDGLPEHKVLVAEREDSRFPIVRQLQPLVHFDWSAGVAAEIADKAGVAAVALRFDGAGDAAAEAAPPLCALSLAQAAQYVRGLAASPKAA